MRVEINGTLCNDDEVAQLRAAMKDRVRTLEKAEKQCAKAQLEPGVEDAQRKGDFCSRLLALLDPQGHQKEVVRRTQQDIFASAEPLGAPGS